MSRHITSIIISCFVLIILSTLNCCINDTKQEASATDKNSEEEIDIKPESKYYLIAGSYSTLKAAKNGVDSLKALGYKSELVGKNNLGGIRICFSSYENYSDALIGLDSIKKYVTKNVWLYDAKSEIEKSNKQSPDNEISDNNKQKDKIDSTYLDNWEKEYQKTIDSAMDLINSIGNFENDKPTTTTSTKKDNNSETNQTETFEETIEGNRAIIINPGNSKNWCLVKAKDNYCLWLDGNLDDAGRYIINVTYYGCVTNIKLPLYLGNMKSFSFRNFTNDKVTLVFSECTKSNK